MRFSVIFIAFVISFPLLANGSIADKVCNAYKNEADREKCFSELKDQVFIETSESPPPPKYITFKWGSSACRDIKYWQQAIERTFGKDPQAFRDVDKNCKYLREATVVYGVLKKEFHISTELAQIKASDGHTYWIELPAVLPITSESETRPDNWTTDLRKLN